MAATRPRAEVAAEVIAAAAQELPQGSRLGSREELRIRCGVSVGTLHEALRLLQATGEVVVRPGPGGGVFAGEKSALSRMLRDVRDLPAVQPGFQQAARVLDALAPLVVQDAVQALDAAGGQRLDDALAALAAAAGGNLRDYVRASLDVFATVVSLPPPGILAVVAGTLMRTQIAALPDLDGPIDGAWRDLVDRHTAAVGRMVAALLEGDAATALARLREPEFIALFAVLPIGPATG